MTVFIATATNLLLCLLKPLLLHLSGCFGLKVEEGTSLFSFCVLAWTSMRLKNVPNGGNGLAIWKH